MTGSNVSFVDEVNRISREGLEVYDSFRDETFRVRVFVLGFVGDLLTHYENLGMGKNFSTVERWCMRCTGTNSNKLEKGPKRTAEDTRQWLRILDPLSGNFRST